MRRAQNLVNSLIPVSSKSVKDTNPKEAQNKDWDVSNKLANRRHTMQALLCVEKRLMIIQKVLDTLTKKSPYET